MSKRFLIILAVLVLGFTGLIFFQGKKDNTNNSTDGGGQATNHTMGAGTAGVTLVEYGDYQCPSCGGYYEPLKEVVAKYGDQITFQFRNFPLTQIHQNAMAGHRAAEAADKQGKYWEMHDMLYERQQTWSTSTNAAQVMEDYAAELALNVDQFKTDYQSAAVNSAINADIDSGDQFKITGTPTFILNGQKIENPDPTLEGFSKVLDAAIAAKKTNN